MNKADYQAIYIWLMDEWNEAKNVTPPNQWKEDDYGFDWAVKMVMREYDMDEKRASWVMQTIGWY